jgi:hypothetical protein
MAITRVRVHYGLGYVKFTVRDRVQVSVRFQIAGIVLVQPRTWAKFRASAKASVISRARFTVFEGVEVCVGKVLGLGLWLRLELWLHIGLKVPLGIDHGLELGLVIGIGLKPGLGLELELGVSVSIMVRVRAISNVMDRVCNWLGVRARVEFSIWTIANARAKVRFRNGIDLGLQLGLGIGLKLILVLRLGLVLQVVLV